MSADARARAMIGGVMLAEQSSPRTAVFLDALGTLIRLDQPWPALVELLRDRHGIEVDLAAARRAMLAEMDHYRRECVRASNPHELGRLRTECAEIVRAQLDPALRDLGDEALVGTLLDALRFEPYDDAVPALERWRAGGKTLIVVSNWDISLHDVLAATGLRRLLDGVVCSAEVGASKPDPAVFDAALELAGLPADRVVHIGDGLEEDVGGAQAAGIEAVLLHRSAAALDAPAGLRVIASLREW
jgi:putative hydrolase of the HAD superfamily